MLDAADPHLERCVISAARAPDTDADWWAVAFLARAAPDLARALLAAWDERGALLLENARLRHPEESARRAAAMHALCRGIRDTEALARLRSGLRAALDAGDPDGLEAAVRRLLKDTNLFAQRNP